MVYNLSVDTILNLNLNPIPILKEMSSLRDSYLGVSLPHQYHYGHLVLAIVLTRQKENSKEDLDNTLEKIIHAFECLDKRYQRICPDFNLVPICIATHFEREPKTLERLRALIKNIPSATDQELKDVRATDYTCLRYFVNFFRLRTGLLGAEQIEEKIKQDRDYILQIFSSSDVLVDVKDQVSAKDLSYNARNLSILLMNRFFNEDTSFDEIIRKSLDFTLQFTNSKGRFNYYGRSMDSIYGQISLVLSLVLAKKMNFQFTSLAEAKLQTVLRHLELFRNKNRWEISLARNSRHRVSFDAYMYDLVYSSFGISGQLLTEHLLRDIPSTESFGHLPSALVIQQRDDFLKFNLGNSDVCFYVGKKPTSKIGQYDCRYLPLRPLYFISQGQEIVPPLSFTTRRVNFLKSDWRAYVNKLIAKLVSLHEAYANQRFFAGHVPVFFHENCLYSLFEVNAFSEAPEIQGFRGTCKFKMEHTHFLSYLKFSMLPPKKTPEFEVPFTIGVLDLQKGSLQLQFELPGNSVPATGRSFFTDSQTLQLKSLSTPVDGHVVLKKQVATSLGRCLFELIKSDSIEKQMSTTYHLRIQ